MNSNARCFFQEAQTTQCLLMLDHLRQAPFNIQTGSDFSMKVIANSHQGNSPASTAVSYRMTADVCGPISFVAQAQIDETLSVNDDLDDDEAIDYGLDKAQDQQEATDESATTTTDERVNLAAQITSTETSSKTDEGKGLTSFLLGVVCTVVLQGVIAGGYILFKKSGKKYPEAVPNIEQE